MVVMKGKKVPILRLGDRPHFMILVAYQGRTKNFFSSRRKSLK